jgi:diguanylate cyclase (GGDEF)-like protein
MHGSIPNRLEWAPAGITRMVRGGILTAADFATLIPLPEARRLQVAPLDAIPSTLSILVTDADDQSLLDEVAALAGRRVIAVQAVRATIEERLAQLSGCAESGSIWLQDRHIKALGRLVDYSVNLGQASAVRDLLDRAIDFAPYSAELWLLKARVSLKRDDVLRALETAQANAPGDGRVGRWLQSMRELDFESTASTHAADSVPASTGSPAISADLPAVSSPLEAESTVESEATAEATSPAAGKSDSLAQPATSVEAGESDPAKPASSPKALREPRLPAVAPLAGSAADMEWAVEMTEALNQSNDIPDLLKRTTQALKQLTDADSVSVFVREDSGWSGYSSDEMLNASIDAIRPRESRLSLQAIEQALPVVITDARSRPEQVGDIILNAQIRSFALLPITTRETVGGLAYLNFARVGQAGMVFDHALGKRIELVLNCAGGLAARMQTARPTSPQASSPDIDDRLSLDTVVLDPQTGAYAADHFVRLLDAEVTRAQRYRFSVALLVVDIDNFGSLAAHLDDDSVRRTVRSVGATLRSVQRLSDVMGRTDDDEFSIMLPQATAHGALSVAERLSNALSGLDMGALGGLPIPSASIGIAIFPDHGIDSESLRTAADLALASAKTEGRGRTRFAETVSVRL